MFWEGIITSNYDRLLEGALSMRTESITDFIIPERLHILTINANGRIGKLVGKYNYVEGLIFNNVFVVARCCDISVLDHLTIDKIVNFLTTRQLEDFRQWLNQRYPFAFEDVVVTGLKEYSPVTWNRIIAAAKRVYFPREQLIKWAKGEIETAIEWAKYHDKAERGGWC